MATVTAFLKHGFISKAKQAQPYTAMAHARYIMRTEATQHVYSERMPKQWHAVQRFLEQHENGLRKNGRVMDKFIISIPHDVSESDAITTLRRFGNWLGQGRTPFLFSLQGFDTRNHHAHFIFIDRDVETGKRVYGTTELNSTHGIKLEWERVANAAFEEMGYDVRIAVKEGYELAAENDNAATADPLSTDVEVEAELGQEDTLPEDDESPEDDMGEVVAIDPVATVRFLHDRVGALEYLNRCQNRYEEAKARHAWLVSEKEKLTAEAGDYEVASLFTLQDAEVARERFEGLRRENGKLKGIGISVFGFTVFRTKKRKLAEDAQVRAYQADIEKNHAEYTRRSYSQKIEKASVHVAAAEDEAYHRKAELESLYGVEEDMKKAKELLQSQIGECADMVSLEVVREAYLRDALTPDEWRTYLVESGHHAEVLLFDEQNGIDEDGGASL